MQYVLNLMSEHRISRRRFISRISVLAVAGACGARAGATGLHAAVANLAAAAAASGNPPAIGLIEVVRGELGIPFAVGVKASGSAGPVGADGRWHIGSNAKSMTATMIARLVERGVLDWDAPLPDLLPDVGMREEYRRVVLPDLLSHRAGLARNSAAGLERMPDGDPRTEQERRQDYIAAALMEAPAGPVGAGEGSYSNTGFVIAGAIAERITGLSFEALMHQEVFTPLNMKTVGFGGTPRGEIAGHSNGKPVHDGEGDNPDFLRPAGGLYLSLADWGAYVLDQMRGQRGEGRLLSRASYEFLHTPQAGSHNGLGWGLESAPGGKPMWSHDGSNGRWFGIVAVLPEDGNAVMAVANAAGAGVERTINRLVVRSLGLA
jgi:CubicO group peptidase (beta-lactamase class C family)